MRTRTLRAAAMFGAAALALAACGDDTTTAEPDATDPGVEEPADGDMGTGGMDDEGMDDGTGGDAMGDDATDGEMAALPTGEFGPACGEIPADGPGSSEGMMEDPVATAASNNPVLSTLVDLVGEAGLADTLNNAEGLTVFAPADSAFEALQAEDPELFDMVAGDVDLLTDVLTYHVVEGEMDAQALADAGSAGSMLGQDLTVTADGETVTVEAAGSTATVVCGNVQTANATVHIIDTVLVPDVG